MNQADFDGTESVLLLMTVDYNFLSLFRQIIMGGKVRNRLKALRHKMLAIPSIMERNDDKVVVSMALHMNRRNWISKLCERIESQYAQSG
jgi:predicted DNA-binding protein (MmcQ/YjbR family)